MKITFELDTTNKDEFNEETKKALATLLGFEMEEEEDEAPPVKKKKPVVEEEEDDEPPVAKKKKPVVVEIPEEDDDDETGEDDNDAKPTQARVTEKCQELISEGKAAKLKAVLAEFGYTKVVQIKSKDFVKFMAKANKIK